MVTLPRRGLEQVDDSEPSEDEFGLPPEPETCRHFWCFEPGNEGAYCQKCGARR